MILLNFLPPETVKLNRLQKKTRFRNTEDSIRNLILRVNDRIPYFNQVGPQNYNYNYNSVGRPYGLDKNKMRLHFILAYVLGYRYSKTYGNALKIECQHVQFLQKTLLSKNFSWTLQLFFKKQEPCHVRTQKRDRMEPHGPGSSRQGQLLGPAGSWLKQANFQDIVISNIYSGSS